LHWDDKITIKTKLKPNVCKNHFFILKKLEQGDVALAQNKEDLRTLTKVITLTFLQEHSMAELAKNSEGGGGGGGKKK
jgi:hypothetical protein